MSRLYRGCAVKIGILNIRALRNYFKNYKIKNLKIRTERSEVWCGTSAIPSLLALTGGFR